MFDNEQEREEKKQQLKAFAEEMDALATKAYDLGERMAGTGIILSLFIDAVVGIKTTHMLMGIVLDKLESGGLEKMAEEAKEKSGPNPSPSDLSSLENLIDSAIPPKGGWLN